MRSVTRVPRFVRWLSLLSLGALLLALGGSPRVSSAQEQQDVVDTAVAAGSFSTLATALTEAGLVETLKGPGPYTVFAPTDEAFAALPAGTLEALLADKEALTAVLTYHVVAGNVPASQVVTMSSATTLQGESVRISVMGDTVMVNDATVVQADVMASNGVIHVIDTVLLPPSMMPANQPSQLPVAGMVDVNTTLPLALGGLAVLVLGFGLALRRYATASRGSR